MEPIPLTVNVLAHDLGNMVSAALGHLTLAERSVSTDSTQTAQSLAKALQATQQVKELTQQILATLDHRSSAQLNGHGECNLESAIRQSLQTLGLEEKYCVDVRIDIRECGVALSALHLSQIITNLVLNAVQAMPEGGIITIQAHSLTLTPPAPSNLRAGKYALIKIVDTGPGIAPEHLKKLFTAHFTTKSTGHGLGLTSVKTILESIGGAIELTSELNKGTAATLYLPVISKPKKPLETSTSSALKKILVLDDELLVRDSIKNMLECIGYQVDTVENTQAALKACKKAIHEKTPFEIAIIDWTLKDRETSTETLKKLKSIDPNLRAILCTGHADVVQRANELGFNGSIQKPYSLEDIKQALKH